jgi:hypothetical protein
MAMVMVEAVAVCGGGDEMDEGCGGANFSTTVMAIILHAQWHRQ